MIPRWKINGVVLPDEIDYIIIYENDGIKNLCDKLGLKPSSIYSRVQTLVSNLSSDRYKGLPPRQKLLLLKYDEDVIKLFMVSAILGVITDENIVRKITEQFIKVVVNGGKTSQERKT